MKEVRHIFRPELLNRLDDIVAFKALSDTDLKEVRECNITLAEALSRMDRAPLVAFECFKCCISRPIRFGVQL